MLSMPEWVQCIELTRLNQVLLVRAVPESLILRAKSDRKAQSAERLANSDR